MRQNARKVLDAFARGEAAAGDSKRTITTDGSVVYSYRMPIAARRADGSVVVVEYIDAPTATTKSQVRACEAEFPNARRVPRDRVLAD